MEKKITAENIFQMGALINVKIGNWTARMKLPKEMMGDLPFEIVRSVNDLLIDEEKEKLKAIEVQGEELRSGIKEMSIPFPIDGIYFMPQSKISKAVIYLQEGMKIREELIKEFLEVVDEGKRKFEEKYPEFYRMAVKKGKYRTKEQIGQRFWFRYTLFQIAEPSKQLKEINPDLFKEEMDKFKGQIDEMKKEVLSVVCNELLYKADLLAKQTTESKPNQKTLNTLSEFFDKIEDLYSDFIDREDVMKAVNKFKKAVGSTSADLLRDNESFKEEFSKKMRTAVKDFKNLPNVEFKRAIEF